MTNSCCYHAHDASIQASCVRRSKDTMRYGQAIVRTWGMDLNRYENIGQNGIFSIAIFLHPCIARKLFEHSVLLATTLISYLSSFCQLELFTFRECPSTTCVVWTTSQPMPEILIIIGWLWCEVAANVTRDHLLLPTNAEEDQANKRNDHPHLSVDEAFTEETARKQCGKREIYFCLWSTTDQRARMHVEQTCTMNFRWSNVAQNESAWFRT